MGKIKSKMIRRTVNSLINEDIEFSKDFEKNKQILRNMPLSKKLRNQMAGLIAKIKKDEPNAQK